jgi:hypothetical protein
LWVATTTRKKFYSREQWRKSPLVDHYDTRKSPAVASIKGKNNSTLTLILEVALNFPEDWAKLQAGTSIWIVIIVNWPQRITRAFMENKFTTK